MTDATTPHSPSSQLSDIHAMLDSGHHSVRIEKHTFLLWGIAVALILILVDWMVAQKFFAVRWQNLAFYYSLISVVLVFTAVTDYRMTRQARQERGETVSFVQQQLLKLWWFLVALSFLIGIAFDFIYSRSHFYLYPILLSLLGVGLYTHGLFSRQALRQSGYLLFGLAILSLVLAHSDMIPFSALRWFFIAALGIGFPLFAFMVDQTDSTQPIDQENKMMSFGKKAGMSALWLLAVMLPVMTVFHFKMKVPTPTGQKISLEAFRAQPASYAKGDYIITLAKGTAIPMAMTMNGNIFASPLKENLTLTLKNQMLVALKDGKADGRVKIGDKAWQDRNKRGIALWSQGVHSDLTAEKGPHGTIKLKMHF